MASVPGENNLRSISETDRRYIIQNTNYVSCLGWDIAEDTIQKLYKWLGFPKRTLTLGTREHYEEYCRLISLGEERNRRTGERCEENLHPDFEYYEGSRVEVTYPDGETERFWVHKSTGWMPQYLRIKKRNSRGGDAISPREVFKSVKYLYSTPIIRGR